jgi:hypothetical protein
VGSRTLVLAGALALAGLACASPPRRFPLRPPFTVDTDLRSVSLPCRREPTKKDPNNQVCAPEVYVSPLMWDGADNSIFRPLSTALAVERSREAINVNSLDEVPDSAWFTNRIGVRPMDLAELLRGACQPSDVLDGATATEGSWVIDRGKPNGASPGFRISVGGSRRYMLKTDTKLQPERPSAASVIGAAIYHAVGFFTSCEQIVYFRPSVLQLTPGLRYEDNTGIERSFDTKALQLVFDETSRRGELMRMQASAWLPGYLIGPFRYEGTRRDDPNDVIPHQHRRELRGGRLLAAWLHHFDAREQNSMDTWIADRKDAPGSSPGHVRHYYLDTSDCFGSEWEWDLVSRRLGHAYLLDFGYMLADFFTLGIPSRPWDRLQRTPGREIFGYFNVEEFVPEKWKNEYPNAAFSRMTEADGAWMARILARFTPQMLVELAKLGQFQDPGNAAFLAQVLQGRLERILQRYLTRLSPITDLRVEGMDRLCAVDLADRRRLRPPEQFRYTARLPDGRELPVTRSDDGAICLTLPHLAVAAAGSAPSSDAPERYVGITLSDGVAANPLLVYLYDLGPSGGYRLVGLERPDR